MCLVKFHSTYFPSMLLHTHHDYIICAISRKRLTFHIKQLSLRIKCCEKQHCTHTWEDLCTLDFLLLALHIYMKF